MIYDFISVRNSLLIFSGCLSLSMRPRACSPLDEFFVRAFCHSVEQVVSLDNLSTGLASDVSGKMTIYNPMEGKRCNVLFKVSEKAVELVSRGLLSTSGRNDFANLT